MTELDTVAEYGGADKAGPPIRERRDLLVAKTAPRCLQAGC